MRIGFLVCRRNGSRTMIYLRETSQVCWILLLSVYGFYWLHRLLSCELWRTVNFKPSQTRKPQLSGSPVVLLSRSQFWWNLKNSFVKFRWKAQRVNWGKFRVVIWVFTILKCRTGDVCQANFETQFLLSPMIHLPGRWWLYKFRLTIVVITLNSEIISDRFQAKCCQLCPLNHHWF